MLSLQRLVSELDAWMSPSSFQDYAPNGLQIEGRETIQRLALGVTASAAVIEQALAWQADALLVHHGYFWKNEPMTLTGMKGRRIKRLLQADVSLLAYHLPLDCHSEFGNNVALMAHLGWDCYEPVSPDGLIWVATLPVPSTPMVLAAHLRARLLRAPTVIAADAAQSLQRIALCTGGAQDYLVRAAAFGVDGYLSGEISERTTHEARELGVTYFAAGHHATERYGVQALGRRIHDRLGIEVAFFDEDNPA